nr:patatin-like phospholipase family protein [Nitrospirota bacterium]
MEWLKPAHWTLVNKLGAGLLLLMVLPLGCGILPGHWRPGWNEDWRDKATSPETAASWKTTERETQDGRFVGLALSGGGSRSANFSAAVMLELQRLGLLDQVDVISAVSGGALTAAYYGLGPGHAGPFTEHALRDALRYDFQGEWLWRWLLPHNIIRFWLSDFTRSDIMVQVFNDRLYHHKTFADFRPHPRILINATLRNDHTRFTFTDERFQTLYSNLARYQVANAVNASSAFPAIFDDVTLEQYADPPKYFHLYDGGPADNLGVQALMEFLIRAVAGTNLDTLFPKGCLIIVIDASPVSDNDRLADRESDRTLPDYFVNTNAIDATDVMLGELRMRLLRDTGIKRVDDDLSGAVQLPDPHYCRCEVRHVALQHLLHRQGLPDEDDAFVKRVTRIATNFGTSQEEQDDLFRAAKLLVAEMAESKLLPDDSMKTNCQAAPTLQAQ